MGPSDHGNGWENVLLHPLLGHSRFPTWVLTPDLFFCRKTAPFRWKKKTWPSLKQKKTWKAIWNFYQEIQLDEIIYMKSDVIISWLLLFQWRLHVGRSECSFSWPTPRNWNLNQNASNFSRSSTAGICKASDKSLTRGCFNEHGWQWWKNFMKIHLVQYVQ